MPSLSRLPRGQDATDRTDPPAASVSGPPWLESRALFARAREVLIAHGTEIYRLRLTRQNRLILTK